MGKPVSRQKKKRKTKKERERESTKEPQTISQHLPTNGKRKKNCPKRRERTQKRFRNQPKNTLGKGGSRGEHHQKKTQKNPSIQQIPGRLSKKKKKGRKGEKKGRKKKIGRGGVGSREMGEKDSLSKFGR